ncbi:MAG: phosphoglucosamine mutase [Planctomycetaceae bacterium]|nr:phosphoglucosamine mutase [Planctomycetaceae bacterium]
MDRLMVTVSGVRGTVGKTLTAEVAKDFGLAFGAMLGAGRRAVIGRDSRPSGPMFRDAIVQGLIASGVSVVDVGLASTPAVALMTRRLHADGGVIITASHNPAQYNGIKFLQPIGTGLAAVDAERLKRIWQQRGFDILPPHQQGALGQDTSAAETHVQTVLAHCNARTIAAGNLSAAVDSVNGAGGQEAAMLLQRLSCRLTHINAEPSGQFAHPPEPIAENVTELCDVVVRSGADVGFAQDADADRLAIVDEKGTFIGEEYTLALAAAFVLTQRKGRIATNLVTSRMVDDIAAAAGCAVVRTPTGEANVVEGMLRTQCMLAGEGGGGVIEPAVVPVRNSLVAMAYVLQYIAEQRRPLSALVAALPRYTMIKTKIPCPLGADVLVAAAVRKAFATRSGAEFNDADGLRIDLPEGWVCVRASNTEPIMRIIAEAAQPAAAQALVDEVTAIARQAS